MPNDTLIQNPPANDKGLWTRDPPEKIEALGEEALAGRTIQIAQPRPKSFQEDPVAPRPQPREYVYYLRIWPFNAYLSIRYFETGIFAYAYGYLKDGVASLKIKTMDLATGHHKLQVEMPPEATAFVNIPNCKPIDVADTFQPSILLAGQVLQVATGGRNSRGVCRENRYYIKRHEGADLFLMYREHHRPGARAGDMGQRRLPKQIAVGNNFNYFDLSGRKKTCRKITKITLLAPAD